MAESGMDITRWPNVGTWSRRLGDQSGFVLKYELIPKRDTEFDPCA